MIAVFKLVKIHNTQIDHTLFDNVSVVPTSFNIGKKYDGSMAGKNKLHF